MKGTSGGFKTFRGSVKVGSILVPVEKIGKVMNFLKED